jgi:hypothetical protein
VTQGFPFFAEELDVAPCSLEPQMGGVHRARHRSSIILQPGDPLRIIGRAVSVDEAAGLVNGACRLLGEEFPLLTPRSLDHAIWNHQRSRPKRVKG